MGDILLVDDDDQLRESFFRLLSMEGHQVRAASSGEECLQLAAEHVPEAVIMDVRMPGMDGLAVLKLLHEREPRLPVIIMTAYSTTESAIEATKLGAFDYILKPFEIPDVLALLDKAMEAGRLMREPVSLREEGGADADALVGVSRAMHEVYKAIGRVAPTDAMVLLRGESGTGKELVARAIYHHSLRANRPFSIINCVAIPDTLLESELFGYERGAFTGATSRRIGKIEQASGGTVFLDEIGDMPVAVQAKLLRLLQENQIERLGGRETLNVDVRIIAATNRDLEAAVAEGTFREDLYYRLNVIALQLPPLRERPEDIPALARHFAARFAMAMEIPNPTFSRNAMALLSRHHWQGNVRELRNAVQNILVFNPGTSIGPEAVEKVLRGAEGLQKAEGGIESVTEYVAAALKSGDASFDGLMDEMGKVVVREALDLCRGNRSHAAKLLKLSRPTLLARIDRYKL